MHLPRLAQCGPFRIVRMLPVALVISGSLAMSPIRQVTVLPQPDPAAGHWTSHGPSGGEIFGIAVDQADAQVAYASVGSILTADDHRIGGVFKTLDGGSSWREIGPSETSFFSVAVSRSDPQRVFASSNEGLWRSIDAGVAWSIVLPGESWPAPPAIDPADALHIWVISDGAAWRSLDGGSTWTQMFTAEAVGFDSGVPSRLHRARLEEIGVGDAFHLGFAYSDDRGETWSSPMTFDDVGSVRRIVGDPSDPNRIYTADDIFRSTDRGVTWTRLPNQLGAFQDLAVDPRLPDTLYGAGGDSLFVSRDAGATWTEILVVPMRSVAAAASEAGTRVFAGTFRGLYSSDDLETWSDRSSGLRGAPWQTLALDPGNSSTIYSVGTEGFAASSNGGSSWSQDLMSPAAGGALAVDPSDPSRILASGWSAGIVRSRDAGATWETVFGPGGYTFAIVFDQANPSIVYAADFYPLKSTDGGESWRVINHGIESFGASTIAIDSGDSAFLYMISLAHGGPANSLFRSTDAGESWVLDAGLAYASVGTIQVVLADPGRPGVVWLGTSSGLFRGSSSNSAWSQTGFTDSVSAVAADGSANGALYVASGSGNVFRSLDEGVTWEPMGTGLPRLSVYTLLADAAGGVLYAAAGDGVYSLDLRRHPHVLQPR